MLASHDLRYVISLAAAVASKDVMREFLQTVYAFYPYSNTVDAFRIFFDEQQGTLDTESIVGWVDRLFRRVYSTSIQIFDPLPEPTEWGPVYWRLLFSLQAVSAPATTGKFFISFLIDVLPYILPCDKCREHLLKYLEEHPIDGSIFLWLTELRIAIAERIREVGRTFVAPLKVSSVSASASSSSFGGAPRNLYGSTPLIVLPPGYVIQRRGCKCSRPG